MNAVIAGLGAATVAFMLGILLWFVPEPDLAIVLIGSFLLLAWDFWSQLRPGRKESNRP